MNINVGGNQVKYEIEGPDSAPVVLMSHSLAADLSQWDPQVAELARNYRVVRYDILGHGGTDAPAGPYTLDKLAEQAAGLLKALGIDRVHFLGLSLGGMIGQVLALREPQCLASLLLCDTTSRILPETRPLWDERIKISLQEGMEPLVEPTITRWFTPGFRKTQTGVVEKVRGMIRKTPPAGYAGCCQAIAPLDLTARLHGVRLETLIVVGEEDPGTPVAMSREIQGQIHGSELVIIPEASHLSNLEQPDAFNRAVTSFLTRVAPVPRP